MTGTIRLLRVLVTTVLTASLAAGGAVAAGTDEAAVLEEMVALEQSKLDPWYGKSETEVYLSEVGDETTYFNDATGALLEGEAVRDWLAGFEGLIPPFDYEITNPSVAVRGDVVIFAFNIDMADPETGEPMGQWMVTKVLERTDDGWVAIHGHFGMPTPLPEE